MGQIKYGGIWHCSSEFRWSDEVAPHETLIGSRILHTSEARSGRLLRFISQHLIAKWVNCLACTNGQSPAVGSSKPFKVPLSNAYCTSFGKPKADRPVNKRNNIIPNEYVSDFRVSSPVARNSGSMYAKVPFGSVLQHSVVLLLESSFWEIARHIPKSLSLLI